MKQYTDMLQHIIDKGVLKPTRAVLQSTGERVHAFSVFGYQNRYDLTDGFPAVTTKKLAFKAVVAELLWFLAGDTNVKTLQAQGVHIWNQWANAEGDVGPVYGKQWRSWVGPQGQTVDQIRDVIQGITDVKNTPHASVGRRLIVSAWNPVDVPAMALPACHAFFQFSVTGGKLSCQLYQRSADAFLGVPFNIASYALLTHLIALKTGLQVGDFIHTFGDLHIYANHIEQVREQIAREPFPLPRLLLPSELPSLESIDPTQIRLDSYQSHPALRGEVAV
jgi:thymidylate synthase